MTDNEPQYSGQPFKWFVDALGIKHVTSSPHCAQSNGFIEKRVRNLKPIVKKALRNGSDIRKITEPKNLIRRHQAAFPGSYSESK